ncbi:hypothetical protein NUITMVS3_01930 [Shewanella xiamenensis]|nr:hypothetical protein NUITMVS2_30140 [Shewanella xiamenensis]GLD75762.1 hypothetical protein NUITMVS3_01930 [Shewanella xiamenensis]
MTTAYITSKASSRTHPKLYGPIYFVLNTPFFNELAQFIALDAVPAIVDCPYLNHFNFGQVVGKHKVHYVIDLYWVAGFIVEQSDHTSIQLRILAALKGEQPSNLLPFIGNECDNQPNGIAFSLTDYLQLVDDTGRIIRNDKRGCISESSAKILNRLNIPHDNWLKLTTEFGKLFYGPVGTLQELTDYCEHLEKRRRHFAKCCQHFNSN